MTRAISAVTAGRTKLAWLLFQVVLFTLPWIGVGLVHAFTGRDLGGGLQPAWLLLFLVVALQLPELVGYLTRVWRSWLPAAGPLVLALILSGLGLWLAPSGEPLNAALWRFSKQLVQVAVMLPFVAIPAFYLARGCGLEAMARPLVGGALLQVFYGLLQGVHFYHPLGVVTVIERFFTSNPSILAGSGQLYLGNVLQEIPRLRGTACEPLYLGNYLLLALPMTLATGWRRRWQGAVGLLLFLLLVLTWSRGAWLAGLGTVGLAIILMGSRIQAAVGPMLRRRSVVAGVLGGLALVVVLSVCNPELALPWRRFMQTFSRVDWSNLTRIYSMQAAWRAFMLSPLVGIGWGQFAFHFPLLVDPVGLQSMFTWPVVNNLPLEILCETGIVGAGAFCWLVFSMWRGCRRKLGTVVGRPYRELFLLALAAGAIWLQLLTFSQYNLPHIWVATGLLVGYRTPPSGENARSGR